MAAGAFSFGWILCIDRFGWIGGLLGWWPSSIVAAVVGGLVTIGLTRLRMILAEGLLRVRKRMLRDRRPGIGDLLIPATSPVEGHAIRSVCSDGPHPPGRDL